jgi:DNA-directed RNA polymerase specialized sigma24 family protein
VIDDRVIHSDTVAAAQAWFDQHAGPLVRPYTITGGRTRPRGNDLTLITLVVARSSHQKTARMRPEPAEILELCREQPLAVAEIAGRLDLPISVVKVLLGDLIEDALILTRTPVAMDAPDIRLIQRVIEGVRRL